MFTQLTFATSLSLVAALSPAAPPPAAAATEATAPAPASLDLDSARFELHLGLRGGLRSLGAPVAGGGGLQLGLGVRLWRGLYLEVGVGEGLYTDPEQSIDADSSSSSELRHLGHTSAPAGSTDGENLSAANEDPAMRLAGQILLALRYEFRQPRRLRPHLSLGLTHLHEATIADFLDQPGRVIFGVADSIRHRTGIQAGAGLRVPFPASWGKVAPRFSARFDADAAYYFDEDPGRLQAGLGAGVQVVF
ncbi:hypothetical protein G6O69_35400 [Pseudenhygromyxa sp. WMMC2535]|uniref:hypothetical protein n=1 Tax=Pseudenhygromyxa sp. WMMC2535 TaxID=2712867 RepID=UPI0015534FF7|nr:hypothetical protein [Pseudenhygromyxa sp. WMMC2535]NVB43164.1 hypothetical protein [Pseudenhygromyxa sp. WMMC2535]